MKPMHSAMRAGARHFWAEGGGMEVLGSLPSTVPTPSPHLHCSTPQGCSFQETSVQLCVLQPQKWKSCFVSVPFPHPGKSGWKTKPINCIKAELQHKFNYLKTVKKINQWLLKLLSAQQQNSGTRINHNVPSSTIPTQVL